MDALLVLAMVAAAPPGGAVTIEKATIPWSELERLLQREGKSAVRAAPVDYSVSRMEVSGEVSPGGASLSVELEVQVLADRWVVAPLLGEGFNASRVSVSAPNGRRGLLVRDGRGLSVAASGAGTYGLVLSVEGAMERTARGARVRLAPASLVGGRASLVVREAESVEGATPWRARRRADGALDVEAVLGAAGLELVLPGAGAEPGATGEASPAIEDLEAVTVVSLGGSGVTRLSMRVRPGAEQGVDVVLPAGASAWKLYAGRTAIPLAAAAGRTVHVPLKGAARVELAYTFEGTRLGIRGRYRVELPRLPVTVRGARWELWLPDGLRYAETQAALTSTECLSAPEPTPLVPITRTGSCRAFTRPVLEPTTPYVEGTYEQPL